MTAESRVDRAVGAAVVAIDCAGEHFEARVTAIPPRGTRQSRVALPREADCEETLIRLKSADW